MKYLRHQTALILAAEKGYGQIVRLLIEGNALIDAKDSDGRSALSLAAECGHIDVVKMLVNREASMDSVNGIG